jgi:uncharacterized membrane protein YqhA
VIGCIALTLGAVLMALGRIIYGFIFRIAEFDFTAKSSKAVAIASIEIIDLFLVATVAYITAVGLHKLFINKDFELPGLLVIKNLSDRENKIIGVIVAALAIAVLGLAADDQPYEILHYGAGVAMVIAALSIFLYINTKNKTDKKNN